MRIDVLTIFPDLVTNFAAESLLGKAQTSGRVDLRCHDLREEGVGVHRSVDDAPFGGGPGMVMTPGPIAATVEREQPPRPLLYLGPGGDRLTQVRANELAGLDGFSLLCGRYEGVDQRVLDTICDGELSIGDYVLSGGEVAALVVIEAVVRLLPGVMGNDGSAADESFNGDLLEYPHYTRPGEFEGQKVPPVLTSGDHGRVDRWRRAQAIRRTLDRRPDLIAARGGISSDEQALLDEFDL